MLVATVPPAGCSPLGPGSSPSESPPSCTNGSQASAGDAANAIWAQRFAVGETLLAATVIALLVIGQQLLRGDARQRIGRFQEGSLAAWTAALHAGASRLGLQSVVAIGAGKTNHLEKRSNFGASDANLLVDFASSEYRRRSRAREILFPGFPFPGVR